MNHGDEGVGGDRPPAAEGGTFSDADLAAADQGGIITARGTGDGLVIRLDGRVGKESLKDALADFVMSRRAFLSGNDVALEWVGMRPDDSFVNEISLLLSKDFGMSVRSSKLRDQIRVAEEPAPAGERSVVRGVAGSTIRSTSTTSARSTSLFDGIEALRSLDASEGEARVGGVRAVSSERGERPGAERAGDAVGDDSLWDDADARVVYTTLRSGQKIETEHSLVVIGDVNSGAELVAGGDIIVLGCLRGVAHAGAYDESGGGRIIFAIDLQPTQLRIGLVISRGGTSQRSRGPEVARVDGNIIVVQPYQARLIASRKRL